MNIKNILLTIAVTVGSIATGHAELPLPAVPDSLRVPQARADYIITHFWDPAARAGLDSYPREEVEQAFANFISVFPIATDEARQQAMSTLIARATGSPLSYTFITEIAEKYLYDADSPLVSEDYFILFLRGIIDSPTINRAAKVRPRMQLEAALKNRPGMTAADFAYETLDGHQATLHTTPANDGSDFLLIFFDPDCDHCLDVMGRITADATIGARVADGSLTILAIYSGEERELWQTVGDSLPSQWIVGYDDCSILENGTYVIRNYPTLYLLDSNKRVTAKELSVDNLLK